MYDLPTESSVPSIRELDSLIKESSVPSIGELNDLPTESSVASIESWMIYQQRAVYLL